MKELHEYREKLVKRLDEVVVEFRDACLAAKYPREPLEPGAWSVHQIAVHARDVDRLVYGARARRTLGEDNPLFPNFDGQRYMARHYDAKEPLPELLDEFVASIEGLGKLVKEMPASGWSRTSRHETQGDGITMQTWVERSLQHIVEHLATVKKSR